ncbi:hypothetical protein O9992_02070 [Vibrio lentus]|nr:hypothetical protein [Vibrio lentus]
MISVAHLPTAKEFSGFVAAKWELKLSSRFKKRCGRCIDVELQAIFSHLLDKMPTKEPF